MLQLLHRVGVLRIRRAQEDPDLTQRVRHQGPTESLRTLVEETVQLLTALVAPIVAAEGDAAPRERLAKAIEEAATRYPRLLAGISPGTGATLDPAILIERALALPAECAHEVPLALGALGDYLEFELKNHPGVANADAVFDSIAPLRAKLRR
jgi:hypothetical protein